MGAELGGRGAPIRSLADLGRFSPTTRLAGGGRSVSRHPEPVIATTSAAGGRTGSTSRTRRAPRPSASRPRRARGAAEVGGLRLLTGGGGVASAVVRSRLSIALGHVRGDGRDRAASRFPSNAGARRGAVRPAPLRAVDPVGAGGQGGDRRGGAAVRRDGAAEAVAAFLAGSLAENKPAAGSVRSPWTTGKRRFDGRRGCARRERFG